MDARVVGLPMVLAGVLGDDDKQWIEVMPTAEKARNGKWFFTVDRDDLETLAQSIRDQPGLIPVDFDHEGARREGSTKAAGWFTGEARVDERDDTAVLMAEVQWTPGGAQAIRDGDFKRTSPEWDFHEVDKKTGLLTRAKSLLASTLTNRPFFKELAPVGSTLWAPTQGINWIQSKINAALNPGDAYHYAVMDVDVAASLALICHYSAGKTYVASFTVDGEDVTLAASADWQEAQQEWVSAAEAASTELAELMSKIRAQVGAAPEESGDAATDTKEEAMELSAIAAALGLPEDTDETTILAKAKEANDAAQAKRRTGGNIKAADIGLFAEALGLDPNADEATVLAAASKAARAADRVSSLEDEHDDLTAQARERARLEQRVKAMEEERQQERVAAKLSDAVRDGQITPAEKPAYAKAFASNFDGLLEVLNAKPKRSFAALGVGGDGLEESADFRTIEAKFGSDEADGIDADSVRLHLRAEQYLAERGKKPGQYDDNDYAQACEAVMAELSVR